MNEHLENLAKAWVVNLAALSFSFAQVEAVFRLAGLVLAVVYTSIQIVKALRK